MTGSDVGGDEVLAVAETDHDRTAGAREHDRVRVFLAHDGERVGAVQLAHGRLHRLEEVRLALEVEMDAVRDHFGVGLGGERVAAGDEVGAQLLVVLDDAVVHDRDAIARDVRVGVTLARHAVGGPARVGDAKEACGRRLGERLAQPRDLAHGPEPREVTVALEHGDARRVVAAVLEPLQPVDQDRDHVPHRHRAYDSTHGVRLRS